MNYFTGPKILASPATGSPGQASLAPQHRRPPTWSVDRPLGLSGYAREEMGKIFRGPVNSITPRRLLRPIQCRHIGSMEGRHGYEARDAHVVYRSLPAA